MIKHLSNLAAALLMAGSAAFAVEIAAEIPGSIIQTSASSTCPGTSAGHTVDGSGMDESCRHDNHRNAGTMWHTAEKSQPSTPVAGIPEAPAWLRFDFKEPQTIGSCQIWNHNQLNLTNRGFRHTRAYVSADGMTFAPVKVGGLDVFEIPQAKGSPTEPATFTLRLPGTLVKSVILVAKDNWGGDVVGMAEVQFFGPAANVAPENIPTPTTMAATSFPFSLDSAKNNWNRQVAVELDKPLHGSIEATVTCGGASRVIKLESGPRGLRKLLLDLPEGKGARRPSTDPLTITLKTAYFARTLETAIVPPTQWPNMEEVVIAYKTHLDIGFSHPLADLITYYQGSMMDKALDMIDQFNPLPADRQFKWMLPAWAMDLVYNQQVDPVRKARIEKRIKDGHLSWHAFPYTFEVDGADAEEVVRSLRYSTKLSRQFSRPLSRAAKMTDAPGHGWITPTLLHHSGVSLIQIGANGACPTIPVPMVFWWEGPDGSRLLTMYSTQYCLGYGTSEVPPADWKHATWLAMVVTIDNSGPPKPQDVEAIVNRLHNAIPGVRVRFGDMDDFSTRLLKEDLSDLKVVRSDMPDTWIHGVMSMPETTALHRQSAGAMASWGNLNTAGTAWGLSAPAANIANDMEYAYDQTAFYSEHTWGLWMPQVVGEPPRQYGEKWRKLFDAGAYKKFDAEFQVHGDYARRAMAKTQTGVTARLSELADAVNTDGFRIVVFNPLPYVQTAEASVQLTGNSISFSEVVDLADNKPVSHALAGNTLRFTAKDIPAGGYRAYALKAGPMQTQTPLTLENNTLETPHFRAVFDLARGGIVSLVNKADNRELVDTSRHALGQFLHERFSNDQVRNFMRTYLVTKYHVDYDKAGMPNLPYLASTPGRWSLKAERDALGFRVTLTAAETLGLAEGYSTSFTFPDDHACVDIAWTVKGKTPDPIPEGGWLCFPFKVANPAFRIGRAGAPIDPAKDILPGMGRCIMSVETGVSIRSGIDGAGAAAASADLPLWSMGEPGLWKYSGDYAPTTPELFANLYNNMWSTNFRLWQDGSWTSTVRVWPVADKATDEQALFTPGWQLRQPVLAAYADGKAGKLPVTAAGLALSRPGIRVSAFSKNPDQVVPDTLLRVWEQAGVSGDLTVTLPDGAEFTTATPVNLRGENTGEPLKITDGKFTFPLGKFAPASFIIQ